MVHDGLESLGRVEGEPPGERDRALPPLVAEDLRVEEARRLDVETQQPQTGHRRIVAEVARAHAAQEQVESSLDLGARQAVVSVEEIAPAATLRQHAGQEGSASEELDPTDAEGIVGHAAHEGGVAGDVLEAGVGIEEQDVERDVEAQVSGHVESAPVVGGTRAAAKRAEPARRVGFEPDEGPDAMQPLDQRGEDLGLDVVGTRLDHRGEALHAPAGQGIRQTMDPCQAVCGPRQKEVVVLEVEDLDAAPALLLGHLVGDVVHLA